MRVQTSTRSPHFICDNCRSDYWLKTADRDELPDGWAHIRCSILQIGETYLCPLCAAEYVVNFKPQQ